MKPPSLTTLHQFVTAEAEIARGRAHTHSAKDGSERVHRAHCLNSLQVLLGYLRSVKTGDGPTLSDLMVKDSIISPETTDRRSA